MKKIVLESDKPQDCRGNARLALLLMMLVGLGVAPLIYVVVAAELPGAKPLGLLAGLNVENPQWMSVQQQDSISAELKSAQVYVIRFPLVPSAGADFSSIVAFTERAFAAGIKSDVIVSPSFQRGTPLRPAVVGTLATWPVPGLSSADPDLFDRTYKPVFDRFDRDGIVFAGIELGNEINWPQFNGDFPVPGTGRTLSLHDLDTDPLGTTISRGFRAYIATAVVLKRIRDGGTSNKTTPILLAGLAEISQTSPPPSDRVDDVDIATTIDFMRANGMDRIVDLYAIHTYAADGIVANDAAARSRLKTYLETYVLSRCDPLHGGKSCWLTEWGATQPSRSCPFVEGGLPVKVQAFMSMLEPAVEEKRVTGLFSLTGATRRNEGCIGAACLAPLVDCTATSSVAIEVRLCLLRAVCLPSVNDDRNPPFSLLNRESSSAARHPQPVRHPC